MAAPSVVVIFSGKRKSGKDYICERLHEMLHAANKGANALLRLSAPLKEQFAKDHNLNYNELLQATAYKEQYRRAMIKWGEEQREKDPGFFARLTTKDAKEPIWVIPDARRPTDIQYFLTHYPSKVITVRVDCADEVRLKRGYEFTAGIDDAASECALDNYSPWTLRIKNEGDAEQLQIVDSNPIRMTHPISLVKGKDVVRDLAGLHCHLFSSGDKPTIALILLHGFGASGDDLLSFGKFFLSSEVLKNHQVLLVTPEGPLKMDFGGNAWWTVNREANIRLYASGEVNKVYESVPTELPSTRSKIHALLTEIESAFGIPSTRTIVGGFSQGAMLSIDTLATGPKPIAAAVALSGSIRSLKEIREGLANRKETKVFLSHGKNDNVVPYNDALSLQKLLQDNGNEVHFETFTGAHSIPNQVVQAAASFLQKVVKGW